MGILALSGCSMVELDPAGERVQIVDSISPTDLLSYEKVGAVRTVDTYSLNEGYDEVRNQAGKMNADVLRIWVAQPDRCTLDIIAGNEAKRCFRIEGEAFRKKRSLESASTKSVDQPQI